MYFVGCSSLVAYRISTLPIIYIYIYYKSHWTGNQIITRLMVKPCQRPPFSCAHPKIMFWHGLNLPQKSSSEPVHMCHSHISCKKKNIFLHETHIFHGENSRHRSVEWLLGEGQQGLHWELRYSLGIERHLPALRGRFDQQIGGS